MDIIEQAMVEAQIAGGAGDYQKPKPRPKPKPKPKIMWAVVPIYLVGLVTLFAIAFYVGGLGH